MSRLYVVMLGLFALSGCATGINYGKLNSYMASGDCTQAASYMQEGASSYGQNMKLLYLMDSAQVNMLCGSYDESNKYFQQAHDLAEDLWTKSISKEAATFITSEYAKAYSGEDFEKALINLFSAVNYLMLGNYEEALVECRRLDSKLNIYNDKYDNKNVYKEDAFARYLSGIIYESTDYYDDAYIDYKKAYQIYKNYASDYGTPMPASLVSNLRRAAGITGRLDEMKELGIEDKPLVVMKEHGRVVLINLNGQSPVKTEDSIVAMTSRGPVKIAFPRYAPSSPHCRNTTLTASGAGKHTSDAELAEDINAIAIKNLDDRKGRVIAKTIARAAVKQVAIGAVAGKLEKETGSKAAGEATRILLNIANLAIEKADTRSWRTLPSEIYIAEAFVPVGQYEISAEHCGMQRRLGSADIKKGETKFFLLDTMH